MVRAVAPVSGGHQRAGAGGGKDLSGADLRDTKLDVSIQTANLTVTFPRGEQRVEAKSIHTVFFRGEFASGSGR